MAGATRVRRDRQDQALHDGADDPDMANFSGNVTAARSSNCWIRCPGVAR